MSDDWLNRNVAPILAIGAVLLTFGMFIYFVSLANKVEESKKVSLAQQNYDALQQSYGEVLTRKNELLTAKQKAPDDNSISQQIETINEKVENTSKAFGIAKENLLNAKSNLVESKEQSSMLKDFILYILGVLSSILTTIFGYYFGSSKSSNKKDETISEMAKK